MRKLLSRLFKSMDIAWEFERAELAESTDELSNPARGWYTIYTFMAEETPDFEEIAWCSEIKDTLALVIINIGAYREKALDETALGNMRSILRFFGERSYDIILRITYDHEGKALEREPFFFKQVKEHLNQIKPVVHEFSDIVFVMQGMLIGNWGEMHTSRFLSADKLKEMWNILCMDEVFFAVRRPSMWRILHPETCGKMQIQACDSMGLFDDAIFGSESHLGTFGRESKMNTGWDGLWNRQEELEFEEQLCNKVPNGGEAVCGENYVSDFSPQTTVDVFRRMHITYLNQAYDERILGKWKEWIWDGAGVWNNSRFYDYIGQHLGYRFLVKDAVVTADGGREGKLQLALSIENTGFANCYQEAELFVEAEASEGVHFSKCIDYDIRELNSGTAKMVLTDIEAKSCGLYLAARRRSDGRTIYFANAMADSKGRVFLGSITVS